MRDSILAKLLLWPAWEEVFALLPIFHRAFARNLCKNESRLQFSSRSVLDAVIFFAKNRRTEENKSFILPSFFRRTSKKENPLKELLDIHLTYFSRLFFALRAYTSQIHSSAPSGLRAAKSRCLKLIGLSGNHYFCSLPLSLSLSLSLSLALSVSSIAADASSLFPSIRERERDDASERLVLPFL
jgi:hypothetical protein